MARAIPLITLTLLAALTPARAVEPRVEQVRQFETTSPVAPQAVRGEQASFDFGSTTSDDASFGVQQLLKQQERVKPFTAFAEISGFVTSNVALTRRDEIQDSFLVATFGLQYRTMLTSALQLEATVRGGIFRYNRVSALNFVSVDAGVGLTYHAEKLGGLDFFGRYNFADFINDRNGDSFFQNHSLTLGAQKTIPLSKAHNLYAGASVQGALSDPASEQRNEYVAFAGYHAQLTQALEADLLYRYGYYDYTKGPRGDHNHSVTLSVRYAIGEWGSAFASAFAARNRSNIDVFDYDVGNIGAGGGLSLRF